MITIEVVDLHHHTLQPAELCDDGRMERNHQLRSEGSLVGTNPCFWFFHHFVLLTTLSCAGREPWERGVEVVSTRHWSSRLPKYCHLGSCILYIVNWFWIIAKNCQMLPNIAKYCHLILYILRRTATWPNLCGISSKRCNVILDPLECSNLQCTSVEIMSKGFRFLLNTKTKIYFWIVKIRKSTWSSIPMFPGTSAVPRLRGSGVRQTNFKGGKNIKEKPTG